jgi:hypothetical protein
LILHPVNQTIPAGSLLVLASPYRCHTLSIPRQGNAVPFNLPPSGCCVPLLMAVAIQPAMPRPANNSPIPIATSRPGVPHTNSARHTGISSPSTANNVIFPKQHAAANLIDEPSGPSTSRPRKERPCDACRRRKSRCVINPGARLCVLCEFHKQECTFLQDPQPRKRKLPVPAGGNQAVFNPNLSPNTQSKKR